MPQGRDLRGPGPAQPLASYEILGQSHICPQSQLFSLTINMVIMYIPPRLTVKGKVDPKCHECGPPVGLSRWLSGKEPACQGRRCRRLGFNPWVRKIPPEEEMATHSSILAWRISWTEEPGGLHSPWGCKELDTTEAT